MRSSGETMSLKKKRGPRTKLGGAPTYRGVEDRTLTTAWGRTDQKGRMEIIGIGKC